MYICQICKKEFKTKGGLRSHLKIHNIFSKKEYLQYLEKYENLKWPICPICGKKVGVSKRNDTFFKLTCDNKKCLGTLNSKRQKEYSKNHPEFKEKQKQNRIKYLKEHTNFEKTAWGKRANKQPSYLEQWFIDNIILKYNLQNKYSIVNDFVFHQYKFDFAFINIKLDVELDGRCHFNNGEERINHDLIRNNFVKEHRWNIFRISFLDVEKRPDEIIKKFLKQIKDFDKIEQ